MKGPVLTLTCLAVSCLAAPVNLPLDGLIPESQPSAMESVSTSRLPLLDSDIHSSDVGVSHGISHTEPDVGRFTSRNIPRRNRGFRKSFRGLFRRGRNTGMSFDEFVTALGSKASCHSVAGIDVKKVLALVGSVHNSPALDRILQRPCSTSPSWWGDDLEDGIDRIPLLDSTER